MRRLLVRRFSEAGYAGERRTSGRLLQYCPSGQSGSARTIAGRETKGGHSVAAIPSLHSGGDRRGKFCLRGRFRHAENGGPGKLLGGNHSQTKKPRESERRYKHAIKA